MQDKYLVGIDIGTTGAKTMIFDTKGNSVGRGYREYSCEYPQPGWVEQDPLMLTEAAMDSAREALYNARIEPEYIAAIALSTQRGCTIFIDKNGNPIKMMSWQDNRTPKEVLMMEQLISAADYYRITGLAMSTIWLVTKIMWMRNNDPATWESVYKVIQLQDFALKALGADDYYVDIPDAAFFGVWDTDKCDWDPYLLGLFDIDKDMLPVPVIPGTQIGVISQKASERMGFLAGTPLCVGAGDQNSASVGARVIQEGFASVSIGTAGLTITYLDQPYRDPSGKMVVSNHADSKHWQLEGHQASAAGVFRWFRDEIASLENAYAKSMGKNVYGLLDELIMKTPAGARGLILMPYFSSAYTPRWNPNAKGALLGLNFSHDRGCLARAFVEGITLEQKDIITSMMKTGVNIDKIHVMGGASKSQIWNQIQADMYDMPVQTLKTNDAACLGAAIFAGMGVHIFDSLEEGVNSMVSFDQEYEPIPCHVEIYNELYEIYCRAYDGLNEQEVFARLSRFQETSKFFT